MGAGGLIELPFPPASLSGHAKGKWSESDLRLLRDGYAQGVSIADIAASLGRTGAAIRNQAYKLEITVRDDSWSDADLSLLRAAYSAATHRGDLTSLALELGRTRPAISHKARTLGLTDSRRPRHCKPKADKRKYKSDAERSSARSARLIKRHAENPHPMMGKTHPPEVRSRIAQKARDFAARETLEHKSIRVGKAMRTKVERYGTIAPLTERGTWKAGWREIGDRRIFFRSRWEANYARYLQWLKERGDILDWEYEPETFWFDAIKRGVRSYKPDFRVHELNGAKPLHEVKGWMCPRSKTTLKRMAKYHPQETILLIRDKEYRALGRFSALIAGWE